MLGFRVLGFGVYRVLGVFRVLGLMTAPETCFRKDLAVSRPMAFEAPTCKGPWRRKTGAYGFGVYLKLPQTYFFCRSLL